MDTQMVETPTLNATRFDKLAAAALGTLLALMASGCGNTIGASSLEGAKATSKAQDSGSAQAAAYVDPDCVGGSYTCPERSNVNPNYDFHLDGSGFYKVSYNKDDGTKIHVRGHAHESDGICIYPMIEKDGKVEPWNDKQSGAAYSQCVHVNEEDGVYVTFPGGIAPNYLIIVEEKLDASMRNYFATGAYPLMPSEYSRGRIKQASDSN